MPTRDELLDEAEDLCLVNPYPLANNQLTCVASDNIMTKPFWVTKVTCDCFVKEMVGQRVVFGAQCNNNGGDPEISPGCKATSIENDRFTLSTDPAFAGTQKCMRPARS